MLGFLEQIYLILFYSAELQLCERAKATMAEITTRLEDKESMNSTLSAHKLEIEKQACALLVGWLCGRHGLQMLPEVAAMLEEFKDHDGMGIGDDVEDGHQSKVINFTSY